MNVKEIKEQIEETKRKIGDLQGKKSYLANQLKEAMQVEFEARHGIKSGDKLTTKRGTAYFYDKFILDTFGYVMILCHPVKKDGTVSKADRHVSEHEF